MPSALCIGLVIGAVVQPLASGSITLSWIHSVERTAWEEDYVADGGALQLREARVKTSGAGMDPPSGAAWRDGWWKYRPALDRLPEIILANSEFGGGYLLCSSRTSCRSLDTFAAKGQSVRLVATPCADRPPAP